MDSIMRVEVPGELVKFLDFVKADLSESEADFDDQFVKKLQETIMFDIQYL